MSVNTAGPVRAVWVESVDEFTALRAKWNKLLSASGEPSFFLTHEWLSSWLSTYGADSNIQVLTLWRGDNLVAGLPLIALATRAGPIRLDTLQYASSGITGHTGVLLDPGEPALADQVVQALLAHRNWDRVRLPDLPLNSKTFETLLPAARRHGCGVVVKPGRISPFLDTSGTREAFFSGLSSSSRYNMNRRWRRLKAAGEVSIERHQGAQCLGDPLEIAFEISGRSWKAREGTDMAGSERAETFFRRLFEVMAPKGWLVIWILRLSGRPIAIQVHGLYGDIAHLLRTDFDEDYATLSPGHNLQRKVIEAMLEGPELGFDMGGQDYGYKVHLTRQVREHRTLEFYGRSLKARGLYLSRNLIHRFRSH